MIDDWWEMMFRVNETSGTNTTEMIAKHGCGSDIGEIEGRHHYCSEHPNSCFNISTITNIEVCFCSSNRFEAEEEQYYIYKSFNFQPTDVMRRIRYFQRPPPPPRPPGTMGKTAGTVFHSRLGLTTLAVCSLATMIRGQRSTWPGRTPSSGPAPAVSSCPSLDTLVRPESCILHFGKMFLIKNVPCNARS